MRRGLVLSLLALPLIGLPARLTFAQTSSADVAAYQLGVTAEAKPGADLTYSITVTNYGPAPVHSLYIVDGWTVNAEGLAAFAQPVGDPDFGDFKLAGTWEQSRSDQKVLAWLLNGDLSVGDTVQFNWKVRLAAKYEGGLVNWARVLTTGTPDGKWQPRRETSSLTPPAIDAAVDPDPKNNRTPDGVTVVTDQPGGRGVDMAIFQAGTVAELPAGQPLDSTWLVTNLGPEPVSQFYLMAGWSLGADQNSVLVQPIADPDFGSFKVLGSWQQVQQDEELRLWLLQGDLKAGDGVSFKWSRAVMPTYRGDVVNWSRVFAHDVPPGTWSPREGTSDAPAALSNPVDTAPDNDRSSDAISTVID